MGDYDESKNDESEETVNDPYNEEEPVNKVAPERPILIKKATPKSTTMNLTRVKVAQNALNSHGYTLVVDGKIGKNTVSAIKSFQKKNSIPQTGKFDQMTLNKQGIE